MKKVQEALQTLIDGGEIKFDWDAIVAAIANYFKELFAFVFEKMDIEA